MPSFSQVNILGYVGNEVVLKSTGKKNYMQLSIGVTKAYKVNKKWVTRTRWMKVMLFGPYAEYAGDRLKKGDLVYIVGEIDVSEWQKAGVKHYDMYVLGKHIIPMNPDKTVKPDRNYGVPAEEIDAEQIAF